jgi:excisionase family DNA binding protein
MGQREREREREAQQAARRYRAQQQSQLLPPPKAFLSLAQVASLLGNCSTRTIRRMIRDGKLRAPVRHGGRLLIPREEFDEYCERLKAARQHQCFTRVAQPAVMPRPEPADTVEAVAEADDGQDPNW